MHCLYQLGRYDEAEESAALCERSAARSLVNAQALWRGARGMLLARRGDVGAGEALAREAVALALRTDRSDTQTDALMDLAEVLRIGGRADEAIPIVEDALRRYELKEVVPAAAQARAARGARPPVAAERGTWSSSQAAASRVAASAPSIIAPATTSNAAPQACSYSRPPGLAGDLGHRGDQHRPDDGIVLRLRAVRDMPGAELAQLRNDRVEVAKRLAQQDERAEEHRLLPFRSVFANSGFTAGAAAKSRA